MFCRNKKNRKYLAPYWKVTDVALESNFCTTVRFLITAEPVENVNDADPDDITGEYFEDIVS